LALNALILGLLAFGCVPTKEGLQWPDLIVIFSHFTFFIILEATPVPVTTPSSQRDLVVFFTGIDFALLAVYIYSSLSDAAGISNKNLILYVVAGSYTSATARVIWVKLDVKMVPPQIQWPQFSYGHIAPEAPVATGTPTI
jgi:hypothetical protein